MTCPQCQSAMSPRFLGDVTIHQCSSCQGVFLDRAAVRDRAELGNLIEAENDWHRDTGHKTQPLPRITPDMVVPPPPSRPTSRAYIETLFT